jgi:DNA-binding NarL/FixJ family response regulator
VSGSWLMPLPCYCRVPINGSTIGAVLAEQRSEPAEIATEVVAPLFTPVGISAPERIGSSANTRELEVAALVAEGLTNAEIAQRLALTRGTVGNHIGHILRALGVRNRAQVAAWAVQQGLYPRSR